MIEDLRWVPADAKDHGDPKVVIVNGCKLQMLIAGRWYDVPFIKSRG